MVWVVLIGGCVGGTEEPSDSSTPPGPTSSSGQPPATPTGTSPATGSAQLVPFLSGLEAPVFLTHAGDGSGRIFIVEQAGRILVWQNGVLLPAPFLDIQSLVASGGERGLLSVAFHPDFETNGVFVVDYTRAGTGVDQGDSVVARYQLSAANPNAGDPASAEVLMVVDQPFANHNGGLVLYGPDGYAYIGWGDGGLADDPQNNAQNPQALLGKMLRVGIGPAGPYTVPADNPFVGTPTHRAEIWATGLRNPWRYSFDRATGDLYIADVGQNEWEEIDFQPAASEGGENYGWDVYEGTHSHQPGVVLDHTLPVAEYSHAQRDCSVTGGYVYRGQAIPALQGYYILGDYCTGRIWTLAQVAGSWALSPFLDTELSISSFGEDEAGELYVVDLAGSIHKFVPA